jgi:hypothetical protein
MAALFLAGIGVLFASNFPDGLESLAEQAGFARNAISLAPAPLADYQAPWLSSQWARQASAGLAGLLAVFALCAVTARWVLQRRSS